MAQIEQRFIDAAINRINNQNIQSTGSMPQIERRFLDAALQMYTYNDPILVKQRQQKQMQAQAAADELQNYANQLKLLSDEATNAYKNYTEKRSAKEYQNRITDIKNRLTEILSGMADKQKQLEDLGYMSGETKQYAGQVQQYARELESVLNKNYSALQDEAVYVDSYSSVKNNPDFEEYSKYKSDKSDRQKRLDFSNYVYHYLNDKDFFTEGANVPVLTDIAKGISDVTAFLISKNAALSEMTPDEIKVYNYYINKGQKDKAQEYLDSIEDELNKRKAGKIAQSAQKNPLSKATALTLGGLEQSATGLAQVVSRLTGNKEPVDVDLIYLPATEQIMSQDAGVAKVVDDVIVNMANMANSMAIGLITGSPLAGAATMGVQAAGSSYRETREQGYSDTQSLVYGVVNGALESTMQYLLGGIGALGKGGLSTLLSKVPALKPIAGKIDDILKSAIRSEPVRKAIASVGQYIVSMGDEALEEWAQAVVDPVVRNIILGENNEFNPVSEEALYSALVGGLTAGLLNLPGVFSSSPNADGRIDTVEQSASELSKQTNISQDIDIAQTAQINPEISQQVTNTAIDAGQTATPMELTEEQKAIKKAAERMGVRVEFDHTGVGEARIENGVIHISPDSANVRTLFVHELTHYLENSNRYFDLMNFVMDGEVFANWLGEGVTQAQYRDAIIRQYAEQGIQLDEAGANKEMLARFISENLFQNQNAIEQLAVKNRGLFDTIRNWIHRMVELFKGTPQERALRKIERMYKNALDGLNMQTVDSRPQYSISTLVEIAQMTEEQAGTTPRLQPETGTQTGDSISKFYESVQASSIFDDNLKSLAANDARIKYYESIANADTMNEANTELNNGGEKYVTDWFKKDPKTANPKDVAAGFILMYRYQAIGDYESAVAVAQKLRNMGTNAGQTVQMFSILGRFTPDGMLMYAQKSLDEAFETMVKGRTQAWIDANKDKFKLTNEDIDFIRRRTWQAAQLPEGRDKRILLGEIAARIQNKIPPQKGQNIRALQRISLLLNPKTNVRNVLGNVIITPMHIVSDFFAAPIDKLISKKTGVRTTGLYDISSVKGFKKGFYESYDDFRRQINTRDIEANRFEIGEGKSFSESHKFKPLNELSKALNALDRTTTFLLGAEDRPFFEMWFINSSNNQMRLNNVTTPTAEMIEIARQDALSRTWQDTNNYTRSVSAIKKALNHIRIPGLNYGLGDIVIKFVKTPANLTKAIVDFSPVGLVKALSVEAVRFTNAVKTGQVTPQMQRNFVRNLGNGIAGSLLYLIVHALVSSGKIELTGDESERDKETDFSRNVLGVQSYSVKIGDKYYSYDWAQPVAATLAIIADFMEGKETESDSSAYQRIKDAIDAGGKVLFDQSFMQSIKVFFEEDNPLRGIYKAILNEPAAFVPQLFSQFASLGDDTVRTSYVYGDDLQTLQNKIKAKIPGLRQQLEPVVDVLGRDVENKNNVFNAFFNPSNVNAMKETPEGSEMYRVYSVTGETGALPSTAPYYVMKNNKKTILTPEQRTQYQRITGQTAVNLVSNLLNNVQYQNLSYKEKADVLSRINSYSRALANKQVLDIEPSKEMKSVFEAEEAGIPMSEYLLYRAMIRGIEADKDKEGKPISGTKKSKILDVINSLNLTREQKDFLYLQQDYTEKEINQTPWHRQGSSSSTDWLYNFWGGVLGGN